MLETLEPRDWLLFGALAIGVVFGAVGRLSGFCFRSALVELLERRPGRQAAAWLAALAVAITGTQALAIGGVVDTSESIYLSGNLTWGGLILGGLLFGIGMMLTRGCGARHVVLAAGGNLRSWVVLVTLGLSAYATLRGILALPRIWITDAASIELATANQGLAALLANAFDASPGTVAAVIVAVLLLAAGVALWRTAWAGRIAPWLLAGAVAGAMIPASWYLTGVLAQDEFEPIALESLTFTAPVGEALQYLMIYTGTQADFGVAAVAGVLLGSFVIALASRSLRAEAFDGAGHLSRYVLGGALMGFGGVLALGCTIGAGLSGTSTLSLGSVLATAAIGLGGVLGQRVWGAANRDTARSPSLGTASSL